LFVHAEVVHRALAPREEHPAEYDDAEQVPELVEDQSGVNFNNILRKSFHTKELCTAFL